jgi:hypothetical protein
MTVSTAQIIQCQIVGWLENNELEGAMLWFKVLYWHLLGGTEETHENLQSWQTVLRQRLEHRTTQIQSSNGNYSAMMMFDDSYAVWSVC